MECVTLAIATLIASSSAFAAAVDCRQEALDAGFAQAVLSGRIHHCSPDPLSFESSATTYVFARDCVGF